jgi:hypothetical protein
MKKSDLFILFYDTVGENYKLASDLMDIIDKVKIIPPLEYDEHIDPDFQYASEVINEYCGWEEEAPFDPFPKSFKEARKVAIDNIEINRVLKEVGVSAFPKLKGGEE